MNANDKVGFARISLPLNKTIAVADVLGGDINNISSAYTLCIDVYNDSISLESWTFKDDWQNVMLHFSPIDTATNKLVVNGLENSTLKHNASGLAYKNASGNVAISKV